VGSVQFSRNNIVVTKAGAWEQAPKESYGHTHPRKKLRPQQKQQQQQGRGGGRASLERGRETRDEEEDGEDGQDDL